LETIINLDNKKTDEWRSGQTPHESDDFYCYSD